ncbi:MAG TPA: hypothetical protein VMI31_00670, partial [Fimbriimonadaceae bacterium]|nr:hypothetical protein [Fimbriimonadaceae bacterium]
DLRELMKKSGVLQRLTPAKQSVVRDALNEIAVRWVIAHRYAPEDRLEAYLRSILPMYASRVLKRNSETMLQLTELILRECDRKCP